MAEIIKHDFEIHEYADNDGFIDGLLYDYWNFVDFDKQEYRYTLRQLSKKYGITYYNLISKFMSKQGCIKINMLMGCQRCRKDFEVHSRNELASIKIKTNSDNHIHFCVECYIKDTEKETDELIKTINDMVFIEHAEDNFKLGENLSYMEKLVILVLLDDDDVDPADIIERQWNNLVQVEINSSPEILNSLIDKGYIIANRYNDKIKSKTNTLTSIFKKAGKYISPEQKNRISYTINKANSAYIHLPSGFPSFKEFSKHLYNQIITTPVSIFEVKQIENYINSKRLSEVTNIFKKACRDKKIPYKEDNALSVVLSNMAEKFNLVECNNIIYYRSKYVIDNMHTARLKGISHYYVQHYFRTELMRNLNFFDNHPDMKRYERPLDIDWIISQTESFVIVNIFRDNIFWSQLTAPEIISKWVLTLEVNPD